jgi:V/A-type H+-transporting ATPase subunit D|tara:strand:+ start:366 stop:989 length:624 start_codon:yes stop_codon:yes gene_type:complete
MASKLQAATRMEMLRLKKKAKLAQKGHKLLKEKRDALISEFFSFIDKLKAIRTEMEGKLASAYKSLILAQALSGAAEIERAALASSAAYSIESSTSNIMGVEVPAFTAEEKSSEAGYSKLSPSLELDEAVTNFKEALAIIITLASAEATVRKLAAEIKKTKRKVNALERILIPRINNDIIYIKVRLEEMERENFARLKVVKRRIEAQ